MDNNRNEINYRTQRLLSWWRRLVGGGMTAPTPSTPSEDTPFKKLHDKTVAPSHCRHIRPVKALWRTAATLFGRKPTAQLIIERCPICGLPSWEDRWMEYVLRVWFIDDEAFEYFFRGRREEDCYHLTDTLLKVFLKGSMVCYPLHMISSMEFSARRIPPDSPEVLEAERILKSRSNPN